ncbi:MAG: hypothetical protein MK006_18050 [Pirellulales bacterium]|nr:hypothetical protein [Pirellulales bacterium]
MSDYPHVVDAIRVLEIIYSSWLFDVADDDRFPNASGKTILDDLNDQVMLGSQIKILW